MEHLDDVERVAVARRRWRTARLMAWLVFWLVVAWTGWLSWLATAQPGALGPLGPVIGWGFGLAGAVILGYLGFSTFDPKT